MADRQPGFIARTLLGDERRIGLWIVPLLLLTALIGAVLTGAIAILYYAQQVDQLEEEIDDLDARIDAAPGSLPFPSTVAETEETDPDEPPGEVTGDVDPNAAGIYAVSSIREDGGIAVGNAFAFLSDAGQTFLLTDLSVTGTQRGAIEVVLPRGPVPATLLGVAADLSLATLRIGVGDLPFLTWRPPGEDVEAGLPARILGVAGPDAPVGIDARIVAATGTALVVDAAVNDLLGGAPLLDAQGRVIGIVTPSWAPAGATSSTLSYMPVIRAVCLVLIECVAEDLGGRPAVGPPPTPVPGAVALPPPPPPAPPPSSFQPAPAPPPPAPAPPPPPPPEPPQPAPADPATSEPTSAPTGG